MTKPRAFEEHLSEPGWWLRVLTSELHHDAQLGGAPRRIEVRRFDTVVPLDAVRNALKPGRYVVQLINPKGFAVASTKIKIDTTAGSRG